MKKIIIIIFLVQCSYNFLFAQWRQVSTISTTQLNAAELCSAHELEHQITVGNEEAPFNSVKIGSQILFQDRKKGTNFTLDLSLNKPDYLTNESIMLNMKVKNTSSVIDSIQNLDGYGFITHINLINQNGIRCPYNSIIIDGFSTYSLIKPGEEINFDSDLTRTHGTNEQESADPLKIEYLPPGNYTIEFIPDKRYFEADITSNIFSFVIRDPVGVEQDAQKELKEIYKIKDFVERSLKYKDFALKYKESVYMDQSFASYILLDLARPQGKYADLIIDDCKWFVDNYPNSAHIRFVMMTCVSLLKEYKSNTDAITYLNKVVSLYSDMHAGLEAKKLLDK